MEMNKYIEPTKEHEGQMVEVRDFNTESWKQRKLLAVLSKPQEVRFICEHDNGNKASWRIWVEARISVPKTYGELHAECGLKVGDWVKITSTAGSRAHGWGDTWAARMSECVGKIFQIETDRGSKGFYLKEAEARFPCFVLEKVDPPASTTDEIIHVPGMVEHWIYKGHAYRLATEADVGKQVYRSDSDFKTAIGHGLMQLHRIEAGAYVSYVVGCRWKFAYVQDDSLLKPVPPEPKYEYEPYTYEDIGSIMGKKFRAVNERGTSYDVKVEAVTVYEKAGLMINNCRAEWLVKNATHLDENGKDTGIPFGKKVVKSC